MIVQGIKITEAQLEACLSRKIAELEGRLLDCRNDNVCLADDLNDAKRLVNLRCSQIQERDAQIAELTDKNKELYKRANESEGTALLASQKYVDYCDLAETKIAELTAKCEKMREALESCKYDCNTGEVIGIAREALEECK